MVFDISLTSSQEAFVVEQARAQKVSPKTYVKHLIDRERAAEQEDRRAMIKYYLELCEEQAEQSGWIAYDREKLMTDFPD